MSASSTPTRSPLAFIPSARLAATVDLPTPPFPEATATMARTPGASGCAAPCPGRGGAVCGAAARAPPVGLLSAVNTAVTDTTSGNASMARSAALRKGSRRAPRSGSTSIANPILPSRITTPVTMPSETMSPSRSGSRTARSASRIMFSVTGIPGSWCGGFEVPIMGGGRVGELQIRNHTRPF